MEEDGFIVVQMYRYKTNSSSKQEYYATKKKVNYKKQ